MSEPLPTNVDFIDDFSISSLKDLNKTVSLLLKKEKQEPLSTYEKALVKLHLATLQGCRVIDLSGQSLDRLPREIEIFSFDLIELNLGSNNLTSLPSSLANLKGLKRLTLDNNRLSHLPSEIGLLTSLTDLSLHDNQLGELPPELGRLSRLRRFDASNNLLRTLPTSLRALELKEIDLRGNLFNIPPEIVNRSPREIVRYLLQSTTGDARSISEAKVLFIGEGGVGKTSIVKRMTEESFDEYESKTEGILIKNWHVDIRGHWIRLNVWDFGGQEIMHATHQFFLTERSVYVLVWDARQEDDYGQLEYWLNIISSFGNKAPVIVVLNKIDIGLTEIDRRGLQGKFPNIKGFVNCSCKTGRGVDELREMLCWHAYQLPHITTTWPAKWFSIKAQLEQTNKDYFSLAEYESLCSRASIDKRDRSILLQFLHDLGIVLSFHRDARLCDTNVLNPEWATGGVYKILNDKELFGRGILSLEDIARILDDLRYPRDKHGFIINIMQKFEICYQIDDGEQNVRFLLPDLLTKQQPFFKWDFRYSLAFQYHYNFLPSSVISRFIVRMHSLIDKNFVWRNGVILREKLNRALILGDVTAKKVLIYVDGLQTTRRDLLAKIRANFEHIHRTIPRIEGTAKVPLPENHSIVIDYQHLLNLEALSEKDFIPEGLKRRVSVQELLIGVGRGPKVKPGMTGREAEAKGVEVSIINTFTGIEERNIMSIERTNKIEAGRDISINQSQVLFEAVKSDVSNRIALIPPEKGDAKRYLEDLTRAIEQDSILPESEKTTALEKTGFLAQVLSKTIEATEQLVDDAIRAIKGTIVEGSSHLFETGKELLSNISKEIL